MLPRSKPPARAG
ncbi:YheO-like PAS domain [Pseudomonas sp. XWY-1]|nr:YheO-like PAS domain [Pseudomonas sp. XWY-1]